MADWIWVLVILGVMGGLATLGVWAISSLLVAVLMEVARVRADRSLQKNIIQLIQRKQDEAASLDEIVNRLETADPNVLHRSSHLSRIRKAVVTIIDAAATMDAASFTKKFGTSLDQSQLEKLEKIRDLILSGVVFEGVSDHLAERLAAAQVAISNSERASGLLILKSLAADIAKLEKDLRDRTTDRDTQRKQFLISFSIAILFGIIGVIAAADQIFHLFSKQMPP